MTVIPNMRTDLWADVMSDTEDVCHQATIIGWRIGGGHVPPVPVLLEHDERYLEDKIVTVYVGVRGRLQFGSTT